MSFTTDAWHAVAPVREAIDGLPFLRALEDGSLDRETFRGYLAQDALYLAEYGRVLALAASQARSPDELVFWAGAARTTVLVERHLHATHVLDLEATAPSPTCLAYTGYLHQLAARGCYPVLVAGVLPCFWVYADVGTRLAARVGAAVTGHPYGDWIGTYDDADFAESCRVARDLTDDLATSADPGTLTAMHRAFGTATRLEYLFWDAAMRRESWPV